MKGTKRFGVFDSNSDTSDSAFRSKRVLAGSPFDAQRAESSQPQLMSVPLLNPQQAESSRQHVRALNTQFASWVQTQLQNHPDELWEDGVRDYLSHASNIMEKFSDVVNWLKANAAKGENSSAGGSFTAQKKPMHDTNTNEIKPFTDYGGFAPMTTTASFATSWSSGGAFSNSQSPFLFGNQSSVLVNRDASDDVDGETESEKPSSPSVKKTEEKGIVVVHEVKCKLYVKSTDPIDKDTWKDRGMGHLSIRCKEGVSKGTKDSKPTIVVRNDVGRLLLNALIYPGIKTSLQKNAVVAIFHTSVDDSGDGGNNGSVVARTFLLRTKTEEDRDKLATTIKEYAPTD